MREKQVRHNVNDFKILLNDRGLGYSSRLLALMEEESNDQDDDHFIEGRKKNVSYLDLDGNPKLTLVYEKDILLEKGGPRTFRGELKFRKKEKL